MTHVGFGFILIFFVVVFGIPFVLLCRLLWHAGSWFKRRSHYDYPPDYYDEK